MKQRTTSIILIVFAIYILAMLLTSCGSDGTGNTDYEGQIRACIAQGGKPEYTSYTNGGVAQYFGCVKP